MEDQNQSAALTQAAPSKAVVSENYFADFNFAETTPSLEEMFKNGVHFGHQKARKHPAMEEYIFTTRKGINIINLEKTAAKLEKALEFLSQLKKDGKKILLVGTKKQSQDLIKSLALRTGMPFVVERWLGGTFTNFSIIKKRAKYLKDSQEKLERGEFGKYTKFERMKKAEELEKLEKRMGGIKEMLELPAAILAIDAKEDSLAISEAQKCGIPVVALVDTNCDPNQIDYPIPANDDAVSSIRTILTYVGKALSE